VALSLAYPDDDPNVKRELQVCGGFPKNVTVLVGVAQRLIQSARWSLKTSPSFS
jgi:hypothetical protein